MDPACLPACLSSRVCSLDELGDQLCTFKDQVVTVCKGWLRTDLNSSSAVLTYRRRSEHLQPEGEASLHVIAPPRMELQLAHRGIRLRSSCCERTLLRNQKLSTATVCVCAGWNESTSSRSPTSPIRKQHAPWRHGHADGSKTDMSNTRILEKPTISWGTGCSFVFYKRMTWLRVSSPQTKVLTYVTE